MLWLTTVPTLAHSHICKRSVNWLMSPSHFPESSGNPQWAENHNREEEEEEVAAAGPRLTEWDETTETTMASDRCVFPGRSLISAWWWPPVNWDVIFSLYQWGTPLVSEPHKCHNGSRRPPFESTSELWMSTSWKHHSHTSNFGCFSMKAKNHNSNSSHRLRGQIYSGTQRQNITWYIKGEVQNFST